MIGALFGSMYATALTHNAGAAMFGANQSRMGLASRVSGNESPREVASLAAQDRALALESARASMMYFAGQLMQESAQKQLKAEQDQRRRLMDAGATLV